jgi:C1A family cysteine protease
MKKSLTLVLLILSILPIKTFAAVDAIKVQTEIKKQNANWISKPTAVSILSDIEIKRLLGSQDIPGGNELFFDRNKSNESLDWRNFSGSNWLGPVMNQGNCGSCVAFAAVASLEARYRIAMGPLWANPTFSPQQLFNCGGGACDYGWTADSAASFLKDTGVVDNACAPYLSGSTGEDVSCKSIQCNDEEKRIYKISDYTTPSSWGGNAEKIKAALKNGPLLTTMLVYSDFMTYAGGIYKHVTGAREGGHAVSLVGFNDLEKYWIIRNSWGTNWGENGFARVAYDDDSGIAGSTWAFNLTSVTSDKSYFTIVTPTEHSYITGTTDLKVQMQSPVATTIHLNGEENGEAARILNECTMTTNNICTQAIDTAPLKDGRYEVYAEANGKRSQVKEMLVLNHRPETTLSFSRTDGKPMSKPFKGRIEFNIDVKSIPVVPQTLSFIVTDMNGTVVAERTTDQVVENMRLGFRFNTLPNGTYKISYVARTPFNQEIITATSNVETITTKN